jgi:hypothetical protein
MSSRRALLMKRSDGHCSNIYAGNADSLMSRKILEQIAQRQHRAIEYEAI